MFVWSPRGALRRSCRRCQAFALAEEYYPAFTGGWSRLPDGQLGFPGNPAAGVGGCGPAR
eukprot:6153458-Pyramimonas_sp.AAC.2